MKMAIKSMRSEATSLADVFAGRISVTAKGREQSREN
jgi:hypothetical protein